MSWTPGVWWDDRQAIFSAAISLAGSGGAQASCEQGTAASNGPADAASSPVAEDANGRDSIGGSAPAAAAAAVPLHASIDLDDEYLRCGTLDGAA